MNNNHDDTPEFSDSTTWNTDNSWVDYVQTLRPIIESIAAKYTQDEFLQEDASQNAHIELLGERPENVRGYENYARGELPEERWQEMLRSYCLNVARNEILSTLTSYATGNIYVGRTQILRSEDRNGNTKRVRKHLPARYVSLDFLVTEHGLQVSDLGMVSWAPMQSELMDEDESDF